MKTFDVQAVGIGIPAGRVFDYVADPANLSAWTSAFESADERAAHLRTPDGEVSVDLRTIAHRDAGTIDWIMTFPDGSVGTAFSRVSPDGGDRSVFSFVLMAPPVRLAALEGALEAQSRLLAEELRRLQHILESR